MPGNSSIIAGITLTVTGFLAQFTSDSSIGTAGKKGIKELSNKDLEHRILQQLLQSGDAFEKVVASKFDPFFYTLRQWSGNKIARGRYAAPPAFPDLIFCLTFRGTEYPFAVECNFYRDYVHFGIEVTSEKQRTNYRVYQQKSGVPVFFVLGVGGQPDSPKDLYILPLDELQCAFIAKDLLWRYRKLNFCEHNFFFDHVKQKLS